jgi:hypothetical protein
MTDPGRTLRDVLLRLRAHEADIYVRAKVGDGIGPVPLSELGPAEWADAVARFVENALAAHGGPGGCVAV